MSARDQLPEHIEVLGDDRLNLPDGDLRPRERRNLHPRATSNRFNDRLETLFGRYCQRCHRAHKGRVSAFRTDGECDG